MPMPYYVSPEQMMQDKAEYAKKGIAKGRSIIAIEYVNGILLVRKTPAPHCIKSPRFTTASPSQGPASIANSKISGRPASGTRISKGSCTAGKM